MSEDYEDTKGFKVTDRRRFDANGAVREDAPEDEIRKPEPEPSAPPRAESQRREAPPASDPRVGRGQARPPIDFISFVASMATNALAALGALPEGSGKGLPQKNPELAREYIDILGMLQQKTKGNLSSEEDRALTQILSEVRVRFVDAVEGPPGSGRGR